MKNSIFTFFLVMFFLFTMNAQEQELIIGKWVFKDATNIENMDADGLKYVNLNMVNKTTVEFIANGRFELHAKEEEVFGDWKLSHDAKSVLLTGFEGGMTELRILNLNEKELGLKFGDGELLMVRLDN